MNHISTDRLNDFDLRDHYWELSSWDGQNLAVWVTEPAILAGEYAGLQIETALVTFRGVRMEKAFIPDEDSRQLLTADEAMALFGQEPLFVFSYDPEERSCELCGLGVSVCLAMIFDFESVTVQWDSFAQAPRGELIHT